jgi:lipoate-protein ligase A
LEVFLNVSGGVMSDVRICGDFFGEYELSDIENALSGAKHNENDIRRKLSGFNLSRYFSGISTDDFISVLF